jgi:hypothetical protein
MKYFKTIVLMVIFITIITSITQAQITSGRKICGLYLCAPIQVNDNFNDMQTIIEAIGHPFNSFSDCYVPFLPEFRDKFYLEHLGDTVMVLFGINRYKALIGNIGLYFDDCNGPRSVCNIVAIDSMPTIDSWSSSFLVLRRESFYNGIIQPYAKMESVDKKVISLVDSLSVNFAKNMTRDSIGPLVYDSVAIFADRNQPSRNLIFINLKCLFGKENYGSALYIVSPDKKVTTIWDSDKTSDKESVSANFICSFDINNDGNKDYLFETSFYEGTSVEIYTFINGEWTLIFKEYFGGC